MRYLFTFVLLSLCSGNLLSQYPYQEPLHSPVGIPIVLAANFGELRSNHFHTGIDIKTKGSEGYRLYAIADGYVSRIKVSPYGYGKAIYIDHPELGITSVYAHCQHFSGAIEEYVLTEQVKQEFFEIELFPGTDKLAVKKGDVIAISGNTGGSSAPHLHFEIRDTKTEHPLNPLLFDFLDVADTRAPEIRAVKLYALSKMGYRIPGKEKVFPAVLSGKEYTVSGKKVTLPSHFCSENGGVGLAVRVIDRYDAAQNVCGIYEGRLMLNADTVYMQQMKELDFAVNRQINTHMDYEEFKFKKLGFEKYFRTPHNKLPIYPNTDSGILGLYPGNSYQMHYNALDIAGNSRDMRFTLDIAAGELRKEDTPWDVYDPGYMYPDSIYTFESSSCQILFRDYLLYEPVLKKFQCEEGKVVFGDAKIPVDGTYRLAMKLPKAIGNRSRAIIVHTDYRGRQKALQSEVKEGWISATPKEMGTFEIQEDTIAPEVRSTNFVNGGAVTGKTLLTWTVSDDLSGVAEYAVYVNGKYQVLEFEPKRDQLFTSITELGVGIHQVKLVVKDGVGNETVEQYEIKK